MTPERFVTRERHRGLAERTLRARHYVLNSFVNESGTDLLAASRDDIERWLASRRIGPQARYTYLAHLRAYYRWAMLEEFLQVDPTAKIPNPKLPKRLPRPIASHALRDALQAAGPMMRCWLYLGAYEGLRCHEIAALRRSDVLDHLDPPLLLVNGKGAKQRLVPLHPLVRGMLPMSRGYLFHRGGMPYTAEQVSSAFGRFFRQHDIDSTAHQLRHWFGTSVFRVSKDIRLTQELMGHSSPVATAGYVAFSPVEAAHVVAALHVASPGDMAAGSAGEDSGRTLP
jgi:integrase/recombinase XerC